MNKEEKEEMILIPLNLAKDVCTLLEDAIHPSHSYKTIENIKTLVLRACIEKVVSTESKDLFPKADISSNYEDVSIKVSHY